jgi:mannosyltransferase
LIPPEHWDIPPWVNHHELEDALARMKNEGVKYADNVSYHQMCRWNSGFFYKHPALDGIKYYWRVEPGVK